jgi:hypothetical protein
MAKSTRRKLKKDDPIFTEGSQLFAPAPRSLPKAVQLMHRYGSDVNGGQFEWSAELERQADGQIVLALIPTVDEGVEIDSPGPVAVVDGAGLFDQLSSSWRNYADEDISEDAWTELASKVAKFDKTLGVGLAERLLEEYDPQPVPPSAAELWARQATWVRAFEGRAVGYLPQEDIYRIKAVRNFVEHYQAHNGNLPQGRHLIQADNASSFWATFSD